MKLREMDEQVTYVQQLQEDDGGPVVLINQFNVGPEDAERLLEVWADDAAFMKQQPGFISTQLHRGTAGSTTFINVAVVGVRDSARRRLPLTRIPRTRRALPRQRSCGPHVFEKIAVPGICLA